MVKMFKLRLGVADDPTAMQPSLNDCLEAMLQQAEPLMREVIQGLVEGAGATGARRVAAFQNTTIKAAIAGLDIACAAVCGHFRSELTRLVYEGGGKEQVHTELLRFEDLQLFEDAQLDESIEVARAQQEVSHAVDDTLPALDALISTMLGWRTIQPGLNPLRPEVFVRALQSCFSQFVQESAVREALIAPAAGLMGVQLRKLYKELADWLRSAGVEPAVPVGGRIRKGGGGTAPVADTMAKTLLTLDRLRKLLAGDFDAPRRPDYLHTVPASMAMLQDMQQVDVLVKRLEERPRPTPAPQPVDMLAEPAPSSGASQRIGQQLGAEVVRLMFDNLAQDSRLLPAFKRELRRIEPAVHQLAGQDSRFFSDRNHPARQLLERLTQRSLAFSSEQDPGWPRFLASVEHASRWLESKVVDADTFGELLDDLHAEWTRQDEGAKQRREEAARALLHAEQRNLLAAKLAAEFDELLQGLEVADFVRDFLKGSWAQVVAEAQLSCADGSSDPYGYRALVDDLVWSVQKSSAQRGRARRLVQMIPGLLQRLREGLQRIGYPPELTQRFFDSLITLHRDAVMEGRDPEMLAAAEAAWAEPSHASEGPDQGQMWLDEQEAQESGYLGDEAVDLEPEHVASPQAAEHEAQQQALEQRYAAAEEGPPPVLRIEDLRVGAWVELQVKGEWLRAQLTWCSPHATLFMFTSISGTAHSMSRRTLDKLRSAGQIKIVADRPVVEEALDHVAQIALRNSVDKR